MDYRIDLDPTHGVIRLTVTAEILTPKLAKDIQIRFERLASSRGPFASIVDLSRVTSWGLSADEVIDRAFGDPPVRGGKTQVFVASEPSVLRMTRMFQQYRDFFGKQYHVVYSLEEAYGMVGSRPEDFTERLTPIDLAA